MGKECFINSVFCSDSWARVGNGHRNSGTLLLVPLLSEEFVGLTMNVSALWFRNVPSHSKWVEYIIIREISALQHRRQSWISGSLEYFTDSRDYISCNVAHEIMWREIETFAASDTRRQNGELDVFQRAELVTSIYNYWIPIVRLFESLN
jgi:hypothetical protein